MQLTVSKIIPAPLGKYLSFIYTLESTGAFLVADNAKVILLRLDGSVELIANLDGEPYLWEGVGREFAAEIDRQPGHGFKALTSREKALFEQSEIYQSTRYVPTAKYAHQDALLFFYGKSLALLKWEEGRLVELRRIRTKGREPIRHALHPERNLLLYGTNRGELYSQTFSSDRFIKSTKVDQLPNTVYQITFSENGQQLFVAGLGFLNFYKVQDDTIKPVASMATAARSFEIIGQYIILNKGMHGIDIIRMQNSPERVSSFDPPFAVDQMYYLSSQRVFLITSNSTNQWALIKWED